MPKKEKKAQISLPEDAWVANWTREHADELSQYCGNIILVHPKHGIVNVAKDLTSSLQQAAFTKRSIRSECAHVDVSMMLDRIGWRDPKLPPKRKVWSPPGWTPPTDEEVKDLLKKAEFKEEPAKENFDQPRLSPAIDPFDNDVVIDGANRHRFNENPAGEIPLGEPEVIKNEHNLVLKVLTETSESLPRSAIESPHKQPPFQPRPSVRDRNIVLDGYGRSLARGLGRFD